MKKLRVVATIFVVALAALAIWVASTGMRQDGAGSKSDTAANAYDYKATDVVVTQMGPDGKLQYELSARQITQEPDNGRITAQDLVMHRDPSGTTPGGPNRLTIRADRAELPESGDVLLLKGNVQANGLPRKSRAPVNVAAEELTYNLKTEEVSSSKPVNVTWGSIKMNAKSLRLNISTGDIKTGPMNVDSRNGTSAP